MPGKIKVKLIKKKKRVPVPQKPPKVESAKKAYDRSREKDKVRKGRNKE
jgi:hypothetical protein